ncbi:MAG TPA: hypothetical protein VGO22_04195 [Pseudorhizobium sp.]|jgi:hypothetical protein|nr:hypothetical protein [Pseudorhizobium sp.]
MPARKDEHHREPAAPVDGEAAPVPRYVLIDRSDVRIALDAGFSEDEVAYMLDLGEPPSEATVDGEDLAQTVEKPPPR